MLKILHLIPTLEGGGAERQLAMLAREQTLQGHEVHIGIRRGGVHAQSLNDNGVELHQLGDFRGLNPRLIAGIHRLIQQVEPDVVQTWLPQMDILGGLAALWNSMPWIMCERSCHHAYSRQTLIPWVRRCLASRAHAIVANSSSGVAYWQERLPAKADIFRVSNSIDLRSVQDAVDVHTAEKDGQLIPEILVIGRLSAEKSLDTVVQAAYLVRSKVRIRLSIIGDGPMRDHIRELIERMDLTDTVRMHQYLPNWWPKMRNSCALISVSTFEGQPNVVLEAMAGACPLIVSDIPAHREILDEQSALFVAPESPEALANAIAEILSNRGEARARASLAVKRVSSLTVRAAAEAFQTIYFKNEKVLRVVCVES